MQLADDQNDLKFSIPINSTQVDNYVASHKNQLL